MLWEHFLETFQHCLLVSIVKWVECVVRKCDLKMYYGKQCCCMSPHSEPVSDVTGERNAESESRVSRRGVELERAWAAVISGEL